MNSDSTVSGLSFVLSAYPPRRRGSRHKPEHVSCVICSFDIPICGRTRKISLRLVARNPKVRNLRRETPAAQMNDDPERGERKGTNVLVSWVATHVRMSSIPVAQSRLPTSDSSSGRGGTLTSCTRAPERVAPRRRFPPKKHTRKSCFGVSRHRLSGISGMTESEG